VLSGEGGATMGLDLDNWIDKVRQCQPLLEDELKQLCEIRKLHSLKTLRVCLAQPLYRLPALRCWRWRRPERSLHNCFLLAPRRSLGEAAFRGDRGRQTRPLYHESVEEAEPCLNLEEGVHRTLSSGGLCEPLSRAHPLLHVLMMAVMSFLGWLCVTRGAQVKELLVEESNVQPVNSPVTVCGDIHGAVP